MWSVDEKRTFNKLKHDLESWRELILLFDSLIKWEQTFYPIILLGGVSIFYLILWYLDFSALTFMSLSVLTLILFDHIFPVASKFIFKPDNWTGEHEIKFEKFCTDLCGIKIKLCEFYHFIFTIKEQKSAMFLIIITTSLIFCAWLGSTINNFILCYVGTLFGLLYPGLQHNGLIGNAKVQIGKLISSKIQQIKEKI